MSFHVKSEVVGAAEAPFTAGALKGLGSGVFAEVTGQLVGPRKTPLAPFPRTFVGLFARVSAKMRLQVG